MSTAGSTSMFVDFCGILAPIASIIVGLSPVSTIRQIYNERNIGCYPLLPYSTQIVNATIWCIYGVLQNNSHIWFGNSICLLLGIGYFIIYIQIAVPMNIVSKSLLPGTVQQHIQGIVAMVGVTLFISIVPIFTSPSQIIGTIGCIIVVILFGSPLVVLQQVILKKDARAIPYPFTIACTINCYLWTIYGYYGVHDIYIYFPNGFGLLLSLAQLGLKLYYSNTSNMNMIRSGNRFMTTTTTEGIPLTVV